MCVIAHTCTPRYVFKKPVRKDTSQNVNTLIEREAVKINQPLMFKAQGSHQADNGSTQLSTTEYRTFCVR